MYKECKVEKMCSMCSEKASKAKNFLMLLRDMTFKSKAEVDFSLKSKKCDKPLFSFKKKFDKEFKVLPVISIALGIILVWAILTDN